MRRRDVLPVEEERVAREVPHRHEVSSEDLLGTFSSGDVHLHVGGFQDRLSELCARAL